MKNKRSITTRGRSYDFALYTESANKTGTLLGKWQNVRDANVRGLIGFIAFRGDLVPTERYVAEIAEVSACHVTVKYRPKWPLTR